VFIHLYGGRSFAVNDLLSRLARRHSVPLVGYLSGGSIPDLAVRHPRWARQVLGRFDLLSAPSPYMSRFAESIGLRAEVTPNPIDLAAFPYRRRPVVAPRLLWMRGFEPNYHPELAVEVLARVRRSCPDATLTMAGRDRGLLAATQARARDLGVDAAVTFPGFLDPAARLAALADHDLFLHTNRVDNTPLSLIEAAGSGLAIVGTSVGGVPDLVEDGRHARLAPDGDADGLAAAVVELLTEPGVAVGLADAAHELVQGMSLERVLDIWVGRLATLGLQASASG
jgi:glycosyltransferase involved in cell wall biosynthesis